MPKLPENLPDAVYSEFARLEVERYDARMFAIHGNAAVMLTVGLLGIAFDWFGDIGSFSYSGGDGLWIPSMVLVVASIAYYVDRDRKNRKTLD